jgi:uncharacterized protein YkwD
MRRIVLVACLLLLIVPPSASAAPAQLVQPAYELVDGVNLVRAQAGLPPLTVDEELVQLATDRSLDMAARQYFAHTTPDGQSVFDLMQERGLTYHIAGENLAYNVADERQTAAVALHSLLNSPPHHDALLMSEFNLIGIGAANDGGRTIFTLLLKD